LSKIFSLKIAYYYDNFVRLKGKLTLLYFEFDTISAGPSLQAGCKKNEEFDGKFYRRLLRNIQLHPSDRGFYLWTPLRALLPEPYYRLVLSIAMFPHDPAYLVVFKDALPPMCKIKWS